MSDEDILSNKQQILKKACVRLSEWFDSVQIVAVSHDHETDETTVVCEGIGNWYSRLASVDEWLCRVQEQSDKEEMAP